MSKEKKMLFFSIIGVALFIVVIVSVSYAYFTATVKPVNETNNGVNVKTAELKISYQDKTDEEINVKLVPGDSFSKTFTVTNNGGTSRFQIYVEDLVNEFTSYEDITYVIKEGSTPIKSGVFPHLANASDLSDVITIEAGVSKEYTVTVTYENTEVDQKPDMGKKISGKIFIKNA